MEVLKNSALLLIGLWFFSTCTNPPDYPIEPVIEYVGLSKNTIQQGIAGNPLDTIDIIFSFTDGDGDIGSADSLNIFITDSRFDFRDVKKIPPIPDQGTGNGITGEITLRIPNRQLCCTFPNTTSTCFRNQEFPVDTFSYTIQIRDRADNFSNKIQTEPINLICN